MPDLPEKLFAEIQRDHLGILCRICNASASNRGDRDELFQDILIALWQALPEFSDKALLSTYVYRVALNCTLNWKRKRSRYSRKLEQYFGLLPAFEPSHDARDDVRLAWLYTRIRALPPVDRSLMLLSLDRIPYDQIAAITGLTDSNVGVRLHRIKQRLTTESEELKHE